MHEFQVQGTKITTPMVRMKHEELEEETFLPYEEVRRYRSACMRIMYISQDRPDLQVVARELSRGMQKPTNVHLTMLKRAVRYLASHKRVVQHFYPQERFTHLVGWTDANHAGCIRTRKSTSGFCALAGRHTLLTQVKGQGVIALSSAEAEYYSLVSGASALLGLASLFADWGLQVPLRICMDATAGIAIGSRKGLGK
eukprot:358238-Amphidinium_carterae.1